MRRRSAFLPILASAASLQALDAAGKDGTIRHVMSGVNPQGVRVESFKVPSTQDLNQDFLRRYQKRLPSRGGIGIFNRSHYEEVLVVRVHPENLFREKLPAATRKHHVWTRRYEAINDWEQYLSDNGFRIVKVFLNLSHQERSSRVPRIRCVHPTVKRTTLSMPCSPTPASLSSASCASTGA